MKATFRNAAPIISRALLSAILIFILLNSIDKDAVLSAILRADKFYLLTAFLLLLINYSLCLFRWYLLLKEFNLGVTFKRASLAFCVGLFMSLFVPSIVGVDLARGADLSIHTKKPRQVLATILLDRLSGFVGIILLLSLVLIFVSRGIAEDIIPVFLAVSYILLGVTLFVVFNKNIYSNITAFLRKSPGKLREAATNIYEDIHMFKGKPGLLVKMLVISLLSQAILPFVFYFTALSLGLKTSIIYFFVFVPLIGAIALIPLTLSGLGLRDISTVFFLNKIGIAEAASFSISLLNFFFVVAAGVLGGLFYVFAVSYRRLQCNKP